MSDDAPDTWCRFKLSNGLVFDANRPFGYQIGFDLDKEARLLIEIAVDGDRWRVPFMAPCDTGLMQYACDLVERLRAELERHRQSNFCDVGCLEEER